MPNWVKVIVVAKDFDEMVKHLVNDKGEVDFNKLIPMPEDLRIDSGSSSYNVPNEAKIYNKNANIDLLEKLLQKHFKADLSQQEFVDIAYKDYDLTSEIRKAKQWTMTSDEKQIKNYLASYYNYRKYGYKDWYDWSVYTWGCKWNASSTVYDPERQVLEFETPWSLPDPVFLELAKYTPVRVLYADEDIGNNCGMIDFYLGRNRCPKYSVLFDESIELANDVWGYSSMGYYDKEKGEWIDDENDPKVQELNKHYFEVQEEINKLMKKDSLIAMRG